MNGCNEPAHIDYGTFPFVQQRRQTRRLARAFAAHIHKVYMYMNVDKDLTQTVDL